MTERVAAFLEAACVPLESHRSGTLDEAERILAAFPEVGRANIYTSCVIADEASVRGFLARDPELATTKGGVRGWDALTHLCFSRYLRLDPLRRRESFVQTAHALFEFGARANTGWLETIDYPHPRSVFESAVYGAAGIAQHAELTRLLLQHGADPDDEETPYHVPETYDNAVLQVLLDSGRLNRESLSTLLLRKCDWHDVQGVVLLLRNGADPNAMTRWGNAAIHQAVRRDNATGIIEALLDHGADASIPNREGKSAMVLAAQRGRADVLDLLSRRGMPADLGGVGALLAACARNDVEAIRTAAPEVRWVIVSELGGAVLAQFAGVGNTQGVRNLIELGVPPDALYREGDPYFDIAQNGTALHVAAWRGWPDVVEELIAQGAPVNARDGQGRTALQLAVKACVDSYWMNRRSPRSVRALLAAGASAEEIGVPTGYDEIDSLLR